MDLEGKVTGSTEDVVEQATVDQEDMLGDVEEEDVEATDDPVPGGAPTTATGKGRRSGCRAKWVSACGSKRLE